jgi:dTDP-4-amino-4,6-dideoxygalactose transaminase
MNKPAIEGGNPVREKKNFLVFGQPEVLDEDIECATQVMKTRWLGTGKITSEFEKKFAEYKLSKYALGLNSCTAALHLGLLSLGLRPGDEVISTDFTFTATISSIIHSGLKPVLVDCQMKTQNIEYNFIEEKITPNTKAIIIVHFAGLPCNMKPVVDICNRYNLYCIEGKIGDRHCGTFGDLGCFSFYSTKNITTACGEGGMVISNNESLIDKMRMMSLHGMSAGAHNRFGKRGFKHYEVIEPGFKMNLTDVQSAFAMSQFNRIENSLKRRENIWNKYRKEFSGLPLYIPPDVPNGIKHARHLFTVQIKADQLKVGRDYVLDALQKEGIGVGVHYNAIHTHKYYSKALELQQKNFASAQWLSDRTISLPLSANVRDNDVDDVIEAVHKIMRYYKK